MVRDASLMGARVPSLHRFLLLGLLFFAAVSTRAQCDLKHDLHASSICGLNLGMSPSGDLLNVQFRKRQYVSTLTLDFDPARRATDFRQGKHRARNQRF
jgi:hypothetical protein